MRDALASGAGVHSPVAGQCTACHDPHTSDHPFQFRQDVASTCLSCHDHQPLHERLAGAAVDHSPVHTGAACLNCHVGHVSSQPPLLLARQDRVCLLCHDRPVADGPGRIIADVSGELSSRYLHGPAKTGDCSACHDPHAAQTPGLLLAPFPTQFYARFDIRQYDLCFRCHARDLVLRENTTTLTGFRDGDRNLHYLHVHRDDKGRTCKACHAVHGSEQPHHIAAAVPFEGSSWTMRIDFEETATGGNCSPGCHGPARYDRDRAAPAAAQPPAPNARPTTPSLATQPDGAS